MTTLAPRTSGRLANQVGAPTTPSLGTHLVTAGGPRLFVALWGGILTAAGASGLGLPAQATAGLLACLVFVLARGQAALVVFAVAGIAWLDAAGFAAGTLGRLVFSDSSASWLPLLVFAALLGRGRRHEASAR